MTRKELREYIITFLVLFFFLEAYIKFMKSFSLTTDNILRKGGSYLVCNNLHLTRVLTLCYTPPIFIYDPEIIKKQLKPQMALNKSIKLLFCHVFSR